MPTTTSLVLVPSVMGLLLAGSFILFLNLAPIAPYHRRASPMQMHMPTKIYWL